MKLFYPSYNKNDYINTMTHDSSLIFASPAHSFVVCHTIQNVTGLAS